LQNLATENVVPAIRSLNRIDGNGTPSEPQMTDSALTDRAQFLLKVLVERYIRDGQPVGSRALTRDSGLSLSAATIRNVMADLEEMGLLISPHTSAGRVPTVEGYRFFIDTLLTVESLSEREIERVERSIFEGPEDSTEGLVQRASGVLSQLTHLAGIVMVPDQNTQLLRQIEFLPLTENRVLVILVVNEREVENRVIHAERPFSAAELQQIGNFLTAEFAGVALADIRDQLNRQLEKDEGAFRELLELAAQLADQTFQSTKVEKDYVVAGETNLMDFEEMADVSRMREMFDLLARKRDVLSLLDKCLGVDGMRIFIGHESGSDVFDDCSVITAPYTRDGDVVGVLGVIGPTRMPYDRVIPIVDVTARLLGAALKSPR
jgi:heat-inducible transcriptional repressor